jgi:hypothetical protein
MEKGTQSYDHIDVILTDDEIAEIKGNKPKLAKLIEELEPLADDPAVIDMLRAVVEAYKQQHK